MRRRIYNPTFSSGPNNGHLVRFFDGISSDPYAINYVADGGTATLPPPPNPDPEYLIFDEWNNPNENINSNRDIGAMYTTVDDATWAFLDVNHKTGKSVEFYFLCDNGKITLDFGDGNKPIIASVESGNKVKASYTYSEYGKYVVKITCSGSKGYTLGYSDHMNLFIGKSGSSDRQTLEKLYCASDVKIPTFTGFLNLRVLILPRYLTDTLIESILILYSLTTLVLPNSITSIGYESISRLYSLTSLVLPNSITSIGVNSILELYSLTSLVLPNSITSIEGNSISILNSLTSLVLPSNLTSIGYRTIYGLYSLTSLVLPSNLTSIGANSVNATFGTLIVENTTPPTLQSALTFTKIEGYLGIYVPDDSVDAYKNATNWSLFADIIYPMSHLE